MTNNKQKTHNPFVTSSETDAKEATTPTTLVINTADVIRVIANSEKPDENKKTHAGTIKFISPTSNPSRYSLDDLGIGNLFADSIFYQLQYVKDAKDWFYYDGSRWKEDKGGIFVRQAAKALVSYLKSEGNYVHAEFLSKRTKRETMIKEAQDINAISLKEFDINPLLLNVRNGTINLQTGQFFDHNPVDFLSKVANVEYNPDARCGRWEQFIAEIMCQDAEVSSYLQKARGYSLSGDTSEECLFIEYGPTTRNGKGTLNESINNLLGDYSATIQPETLSQKKANGSGHSADIARLAGIRVVTASEPSDGMQLNAALVKQLSGGDTVTARFLYQSFFEFQPQFTIFINTNHLPVIADDSVFSSGRIKLIPFDRHFDDAEQDHCLKSIFQEAHNKSAILNWLLDGYKHYMEDGLVPPPKVESILREYRQNSDVVGSYIGDHLISCDEKHRTKTSVFYSDFTKWCEDNDFDIVSQKVFVNAIRQKDLLGRDRTIGHYIKRYRIR